MTKVRVSPHGGYLVEGAISSGTLRTQDLLRAFASELERLLPFNSRASVSEARDQADDAAVGTDNPNETQEVLQELQDELNHLASPHGLYFGTTEDDGACFGFWKVEDCEDAAAADEALEEYHREGGITLGELKKEIDDAQDC